MQLTPGTTLQNGKYRIVRMLGQGGFGITYEAEQVNLGRKVALKEFFMKDSCERLPDMGVIVPIQRNRALVLQFLGKFIHEAKMIASLDHPHIIRVLDVFEENGTAYYVMDNLTGGSLWDKVARGGPLSEPVAERYVRQIADALQEIHSRGMLHLDVKPSNILLNTKGDAVLIDFGISKYYGSNGEPTSSTPLGLSRGFAPLEQTMNGDVARLSPSMDIYALGATLYYLVSGCIPQEAGIVYEDGLQRPEGVSDRLWHVIETAMQPRRKDRPQNVDSFLHLFGESAPASEPVIPVHEAIDVFPEETLVMGVPESVHRPEPVVEAVAEAEAETGDETVALREPVAEPVAEAVVGTVAEPSAETVPVREPVSESVAETEPGPSAETASLREPVPVQGKTSPKTMPRWLWAVLAGVAAIIVLVFFLPYKERNVTPQKLPEETSSGPVTGTANGYNWVDLGLSVKWADRNVGASSPGDFGSYFAWGEVSKKRHYSWDNLKYWNASTHTFSKYGPVDGKMELDPSDDAAQAQWHGPWRMPTFEELKELKEKCIWKWSSQNDRGGYRVTSTINGASIFLPTPGCRSDNKRFSADTYGYYWSSTLNPDDPEHAMGLFFTHTTIGWLDSTRQIGRSIRPVMQ